MYQLRINRILYVFCFQPNPICPCMLDQPTATESRKNKQWHGDVFEPQDVWSVLTAGLAPRTYLHLTRNTRFTFSVIDFCSIARDFAYRSSFLALFVTNEVMHFFRCFYSYKMKYKPYI